MQMQVQTTIEEIPLEYLPSEAELRRARDAYSKSTIVEVVIKEWRGEKSITAHMRVISVVRTQHGVLRVRLVLQECKVDIPVHSVAFYDDMKRRGYLRPVSADTP